MLKELYAPLARQSKTPLWYCSLELLNEIPTLLYRVPVLKYSEETSDILVLKKKVSQREVEQRTTPPTPPPPPPPSPPPSFPSPHPSHQFFHPHLSLFPPTFFYIHNVQTTLNNFLSTIPPLPSTHLVVELKPLELGTQLSAHHLAPAQSEALPIS
jgi:hypothetical protein